MLSKSKSVGITIVFNLLLGRIRRAFFFLNSFMRRGRINAPQLKQAECGLSLLNATCIYWFTVKWEYMSLVSLNNFDIWRGIVSQKKCVASGSTLVTLILKVWSDRK